MTLKEIIAANIPCDVTVHAGNIRARLYGKVIPYGTGGKFIVGDPDKDCIIFTEANITNINATSRHGLIYIS